MLEIIISLALGSVFLGHYLYGLYHLKKQKEALKFEEEEIIQEVSERMEDINTQVEAAIEAIQDMNSVVFDCPCSHNTIRTFIDLSKKENTFICPECKNEYRIDITMVPILKGKIVDEQGMYKLLSSKLETARNDKA